MAKTTQVPTIGERFKAAVVHPSTQSTNALVAVLVDIHHANMRELLEDVANTFGHTKEDMAAITDLKKDYLS